MSAAANLRKGDCPTCGARDGTTMAAKRIDVLTQSLEDARRMVLDEQERVERWKGTAALAEDRARAAEARLADAIAKAALYSVVPSRDALDIRVAISPDSLTMSTMHAREVIEHVMRDIADRVRPFVYRFATGQRPDGGSHGAG